MHARTVGRAGIGTITLPATSYSEDQQCVRPGRPLRCQRSPLGQTEPEHLPEVSG
jgi:hypothetical protein